MELMADNDYEDRFWVMFMKRMDDQDKKLDDIVVQTRKTNGRVTKLEGKVENLEPKSKEITSNPLQNPKVVQIGLYVSLAILLLVAAVVKFDLGGVL